MLHIRHHTLRRHGVRAALVAVTALGITMALGAPANAFSSSPSASIAGSGCSSTMTWRGGMTGDGDGTENIAPTGTVVVCWTKYRISDVDPNGDYYSADLVSTWTLSHGFATFPAQFGQSVVSNQSAISNVYDATPTFTSNRSCSSDFAVGVNISGFSLSWTPRVCSGNTITRTGFSKSVAGWNTPTVGVVDKLETGFFQKVPNGVVPKFSFLFAVPAYTWTYNGVFWHTDPQWNDVYFQNK